MSITVDLQNPAKLPGASRLTAFKRGRLAFQSRIRKHVIRGVELVMALVLCSLLSPLLILLALRAYIMTGRILGSRTRLGLNGKHFNQFYFNGDFRGRNLPVLLNVIRGDMSFVGPSTQSSANAERLQVRPGIVSLYELRNRVRIAHASERDVEHEYIYRQNLKSDLGIMTRYALGSLLGGSAIDYSPEIIDFFGIKVANKTMQEAVADIVSFASRETQTQVAFVNPDCLNIAWKNDAYRSLLDRSEYVLPDGIGLHIGCRLQQVSLKANVNGTDLFPELCAQMQHSGLRLFLLGARPGIAEATASNMRKRFPGLDICGTQHGYFDRAQTRQVVDKINQSRADIVLVAMGAPNQELWIDAHRQQLDARVLMGVGGLFDFYSGRISRAPAWVRELGMEWGWRLLQEPRRMWKRYVIGNPLFLYRVWRHGKAQGVAHVNGESASKLHSTERNFLGRKLQRLRWGLSEKISRGFKRTLDITVSASMLLLLSPLFAVVAVAIRLESAGPILFSQQRVGLLGRSFNFWKFRSMYIDAEQRKVELMSRNEMQGGVLFKMKDDPRITRVGRVIRRTSIDELPQLWNVLRGDMSLVGPRPCLPTEAENYSIEDRNRLDALPGLTCTWQVSGRSDIPFKQQVRMDVEYIHRASMAEDLRLMFKTIPAIVSGRGAY